jgi:hypothetical protein
LVKESEQRRLLSFTPAVSVPVGGTPQSVVTADVNKAGNPNRARGEEKMRIKPSSLAALVLGTFVAVVSSASGAFITVYGGPTYDSTTATGYRDPVVAPRLTVGDGTAIGTAFKYSGGTDLGTRAVRWNASGSASVELGNLGTDSSGYTASSASALNAAGTAVGDARKYSGDTLLGTRAVRWNVSGPAAAELGNLGTNSTGFTDSSASALNAAGYALKYTGDTSLGSRAVRWDASGIPTELGNLGTDSTGYTTNYAYALNAAGTTVGVAEKFSGATSLGTRAVRWDGSGIAATELGNLGTTSTGDTISYAFAVNAAGTAVGYANKYSGSGTFLGFRAVRWGASGAAATELGNLGTDSSGNTFSYAYAVNATGSTVGFAKKYSGLKDLGPRAVRWGASGTAATELGNLGTDSNGNTESQAYVINTAGAAVGYAEKYSGGFDLGIHAVLWGLNGAAIDLNTLIDPAASSWTLTDALGISDTNWVTGIGRFDPDGAGPLGTYNRLFLLDASSVVPEPAGLSLLPIAAMFRRRRRRDRGMPTTARAQRATKAD